MLKVIIDAHNVGNSVQVERRPHADVDIESGHKLLIANYRR